jgi:Ca2+/Na+ antiporter
MAFITELWESVLTPGTTPALIKATHASFIMLIISLISLIFLSGSIHFVNLLVIAVLLYGCVVWFINELEKVKLEAKEEKEKEGVPEKTVEAKDEVKEDVKVTAIPSSSPVKKRKAKHSFQELVKRCSGWQ